MTVGKMNAACWTIFIAMSVLFAPLLLLALSLRSDRALMAIVLAGVIVVWWTPFGYGMYIALAVMRNGDRRLVRRGIAGTAEVLSARATNTVIQEGEFAWQAPRVYKYGLRVSIPGKAPYVTDCRICVSGISEGSTVNVVVSPHNHKRVTIDVGQGGKGSGRGAGAPRPVQSVSYRAGATHSAGAVGGGGQGQHSPSDSARLGALAQLGHLHDQGVLNDAEFATEKARILSE